MQVTVFGASGKVGRQVIALLINSGHTVIAVVHRHNIFEGQAGIRVVQGDAHDSTTVIKALEGSRAIIVTLGSWGTKDKNIVSQGTRQILLAMPAASIERLITLTGAGAWSKSDRPTLLDRLQHQFLKLIAPQILADGEAHIQLLEANGCNWTCLRSPTMTPRKNTSYKYQVNLPSLLATIPRCAVAQALVDQLDEQVYFKQTPIVRAR